MKQFLFLLSLTLLFSCGDPTRKDIPEEARNFSDPPFDTTLKRPGMNSYLEFQSLSVDSLAGRIIAFNREKLGAYFDNDSLNEQIREWLTDSLYLITKGNDRFLIDTVKLSNKNESYRHNDSVTIDPSLQRHTLIIGDQYVYFRYKGYTLAYTIDPCISGNGIDKGEHKIIAAGKHEPSFMGKGGTAILTYRGMRYPVKFRIVLWLDSPYSSKREFYELLLPDTATIYTFR